MSSPYQGRPNSQGSNTLLIVVVIVLIIVVGFIIGFAIYKAKNPTPGPSGCCCINGVATVTTQAGCTGGTWDGSDTTCANSSSTCSNGTSGPTGCNSDSDCLDPSFPICQNNICIAKCDVDLNPCPGTQACVTGVCMTSCTANDQCNPPLICGQNGICQQGGGTTGSCMVNGDCPSTVNGQQICVSGVCENCTQGLSGQCDSPAVCNSFGLCQIPGVIPSTYNYVNGSWTGFFELVWDGSGGGSVCGLTLGMNETTFLGTAIITIYDSLTNCIPDTNAVFKNSLFEEVGNSQPNPATDTIFIIEAGVRSPPILGTPVNVPSSFSKITIQQNPYQLIITP